MIYFILLGAFSDMEMIVGWAELIVLDLGGIRVQKRKKDLYVYLPEESNVF